MAKLVNITPISLWFMVLITIVAGANLNQLTSLGGPLKVRSWGIPKMASMSVYVWSFAVNPDNSARYWLGNCYSHTPIFGKWDTKKKQFTNQIIHRDDGKWQVQVGSGSHTAAYPYELA